MIKSFYDAKNLTIGNGFVRNPDRYYVEEFFEQLPRIQFQKFNSLITEGNGDYELNTSTNSTSIDKLAEVNLPANSLSVGDVIHIRGFALVTSSNANDTSQCSIVFGPAANGTAYMIGQGSAVDVSNNDIVHVDYYLIIRNIGTSGRIVGHGMFSVGNSNPDTVTSLKNVTSIATIDYDTGQELYIGLYNQWSNDTTDNSITAKSFVVQIKRLEIPNNNFIVEGDGANNSKVTFSTTKGGIVIEPNTFNSSIIVSPNTNTDQSVWHNVKWGTENQLEWTCSISIEDINDVVIWSGLKLTNTHVLTTDNDQIYFLYDSSNIVKTWYIVISINGVDYVSVTPLIVDVSKNYKFRISIDKSRFARVFINDIQYSITKTEGTDISDENDVTSGIDPSEQLTNDIDLIPFIGIKDSRTSSSSETKKLNIYYQKISRILFE